MRRYYALVDDILSGEEFEKRVIAKVGEAGGLLDEQTAAMLVVRELGRQHLKIAGLGAASSLVCFFGKVIAVSEPREFDRSDGTRGQVARVTVGDDSGEAIVVLWDERAEAACQIGVGEVLEIFGRPKGGGRPEVHALDLRTTAIEIATREAALAKPPEEVVLETLEVVLLVKGESRQFTRRDGSSGEMVEAIVGDREGTARLVCWEPAILEAFEPGTALVIEGARPGSRTGGREYAIGDRAHLAAVDSRIEVPFDRAAGLAEGDTCSLTGSVAETRPPCGFVTRRGDPSWVRNIVVRDESGSVAVVLWGERARDHLVVDDRIEIYHAAVKRGRDEELEVHVGWSGGIRVIPGADEEVVVEGTVIDTCTGRCLDTGTCCLLLDGDLPLGAEVRVRGICAGSRITPLECSPRLPDADELRSRIARFL